MNSEWELELFHRAAKQVPAYRRFLKAQGCDPATISTVADLDQLPFISKKSYLQQNALAELCYRHRLGEAVEYCATSGSTSEPFYFPRTDQLAEHYADVLVRYFAESSYGANGRTLVIVGFGMGVWIGGIITVRALEIAAARAHVPLAILPTGINKTEIMRGLVQLSPQYDQTLLIGYPPFVKDMLDDAQQAGLDLAAIHLRLMFAAESFNEQFRDYVVAQGAVGNPCIDTLNIYGSAEAGVMATETPLSILVRRLATTKPALFTDLFGQVQKTPTLAQYDPAYIAFTAADGEIALSADSLLPLVRYRIGDRGGVLGYAQVVAALRRHGFDVSRELKAAGIKRPPQRRPFVYVYERSDFAVSLYGATLFPEIVKDGLVDPAVSEWLTERFTMIVRYDDAQQQYLEVNLETRPGRTIRQPQRRQLAPTLIKAMSARSSELREICQQLSADKVVKFVYWPFEHPTYFKPGVKQRWSAK